MKALRSTLLIAIVSLFVLTGYAHAVMDKCCDAKQTERTAHDQPISAEDDGCPCLCHMAFSNVVAMPVRVPIPVLILQPFGLPAGEFPPDTEPQGIDYPPRLA